VMRDEQAILLAVLGPHRHFAMLPDAAGFRDHAIMRSCDGGGESRLCPRPARRSRKLQRIGVIAGVVTGVSFAAIGAFIWLAGSKRKREVGGLASCRLDWKFDFDHRLPPPSQSKRTRTRSWTTSILILAR